MQLDDSVANWMFAATEWWLGEFGPIASDSLALPINAHFPSPDPHDLLQVVIDRCAMRGEGWNFVLEDESDAVMDNPMTNVPHPAVSKTVLQQEGDGTLSPGAALPVPFSQETAENPLALVASFATSLSHYLIGSAQVPPPGDEEHWEATVDLGTVLLGFGIFTANSAFELNHYEEGLMAGWSSAVRGELGQDALGYAIALFVELSGADEQQILEHLDANPKSSYKWARKQFRTSRSLDVDRLRAVEPNASAGPYR